MTPRLLAAALALALAATAAQGQTVISGSASGSNADSGSASNAVGLGGQGGASDQHQTQGQGQNQTSTSAAASDATSASVSHSGAASDQTQGQSSNQTNQQGQMATNSQGVEVSTTFNSTNRRQTEVRTNATVALAASSSFSSDYCGGTASAGASVAPVGVTLGGARPVFDQSCQYLRLAEKAGMLGANYHNMGQAELSLRAMSLMSWAICMAGPNRGAKGAAFTADACLKLGLMGSDNSAPSALANPPQAVTPAHVAPNASVSPKPDYSDTAAPIRAAALAPTP